MIDKVRNKIRLKFRDERFKIFHSYFSTQKGKLLDLGGGDGSFLAAYRDEMSNFEIYVADIDKHALQKAEDRGFKTILINEVPPFPFKDKEWDVVFCNSVIEHYTGPKQLTVKMSKSSKFK